MDHVVDLDDRSWFKRCRRAWDWRSPARHNLIPADPLPPTAKERLEDALQAGLQAWFYPAMAGWSRAMVRPIALRAFEKAEPGTGPELLEAYLHWVPGKGDFTPVRANEEIIVVVPDPANPEAGLRARDGGAIKARGTVDLLVVDEHNRLWVHLHRLLSAEADWAPEGLLALDDEALALCWMVEAHHVATVAGALVDEIRPEGRFRRTRVRTPPKVLRAARQRFAEEALDLTDPAVALYPNPSPEVCAGCPFLAPCLVASAGGDQGTLLTSAFRPHVPEVIPLPPRTGSCGPQRVSGWQTAGPGPSSLQH